MMICWPRSKHVVVAVRLMSAWPTNVINHLRIADTTDTTDGGGGGGGGLRQVHALGATSGARTTGEAGSEH